MDLPTNLCEKCMMATPSALRYGPHIAELGTLTMALEWIEEGRGVVKDMLSSKPIVPLDESERQCKL